MYRIISIPSSRDLVPAHEAAFRIFYDSWARKNAARTPVYYVAYDLADAKSELRDGDLGLLVVGSSWDKGLIGLTRKYPDLMRLREVPAILFTSVWDFKSNARTVEQFKETFNVIAARDIEIEKDIVQTARLLQAFHNMYLDEAGQVTRAKYELRACMIGSPSDGYAAFSNAGEPAIPQGNGQRQQPRNLEH